MLFLFHTWHSPLEEQHTKCILYTVVKDEVQEPQAKSSLLTLLQCIDSPEMRGSKAAHVVPEAGALKGLSHEIDFKNFD
jgi:hypothetical protein